MQNNKDDPRKITLLPVGAIIARGSTAAQEPLPPVCEKCPAQGQKGKQNGKRKDAY